MSELENIVRPFQIPNNASKSRQYLSPNQQSEPPISLYFGRNGSGKVFSSSRSWVRTYYCVQYNVEQST